MFKMLKFFDRFLCKNKAIFLNGFFAFSCIVYQILLNASSVILPYHKAGVPLKIVAADKITRHTNSETIQVLEKQHNKTSHSQLKTDGNNDVSFWSNAFNFQKSWGTQVDPRTGTLAAYTKVGSMVSNLGHGPNIDLEVIYNSNSLADPDNLGQGWSWNLTHFNLLNNQLSTSQGKVFNLKQDKNGQWVPRYHKLKDIQIEGSKATHFVITYANGLRETLSHKGYEVRLEQQDGRWVKFSYLVGTHLLNTISDNQSHKIVLTRTKGFTIITSTDAEGNPFNVYLSHTDGKLIDIALPKRDGQLLPVLHMKYLGHLISRVTYPTGLQKEITYNCTNAMKVPLQSYNRGLCVVVQTSVNPGTNQPKMITRYSYSESNANAHNYLGFNSGLDFAQKSSYDTLFATPASYTYTTTQDNGITRQIRTYNKYHLLINAQIVSDRTDHLLTEIHSFFCDTNQIDGCAHTTFENLPATYGLPLKVITRTWGENSGLPATEITEQQYDSQGRLVSATDAYGRMKKVSYCPTEGDNLCPAEPPGWLLSSQVESVTDYPSYRVSGSANLPVTVQYSRYKKEPNISGNGYILVLEDKTIKSGNQYTEMKQQYYDNPQDVFRYGLLKTATTTGTVSPVATFNSVTKNFYYILDADHKTKTVYETIKLKSGQLKRSPAVTTSLFTNQTIESADAENKNITRYRYDYWGRMIQVDFCVGTPFAVSKHYEYGISSGYIRLLITDSNGLRKKIIFDGAGRQLKIFTEAIADTGKVMHGIWLPVKSTDYDLYGRITAEHTYYVDNSEKSHQLTTTFDYDALGRTNKVHLPDQETQVKMYDDPDRCTVSFVYDSQNHYSPVLIVHGNILDKPVEQMILPAGFIHDYSSVRSLCKISNVEPAARVSYAAYDGFGRKITSVDPAGRKVTTTYDDAGQVIKTTDPLGNQFHNVYDLLGHTIQQWIIPAKSNTQYLLASAQYDSAGELLWKAGEDGKKTSYTYTANSQVATTIIPSGHVISWQYNVIGLPVSESIDGKESVHIDYDTVTALPIKKVDITGITRWIYSDDKKIQQLFHTGERIYPNYYFTWNYDKNRRVISATDLNGNKISTDYDWLGRISLINYHDSKDKNELLQMSAYDTFSRIVKISYGSGMQRNIEYNKYSQTSNVVDMLASKPLSAWQYSYDKEGNIITLIHKYGNNQQAILNYQYDVLNNLVVMNCSGSPGLPLCPRDTSFQGTGMKQAPIITRQNYSFNMLNRMQQVKELLLNTDQQKTASKTIGYNYGYQQAPLRLKQITTQWNNITPVMTNFVYDSAGNMIVDSENNKISYNIFNQITKVLTPDGKQSNYFYDGSGREIRQTTSTGDSRNLFYVGTHLLNEQINNVQQDTHTVSYLGVCKAIDGLIHEYYEQNYKGDITAVLTRTKQDSYVLNQQNIYSPYGMVWHTAEPAADLPWYQQTFTGFNGEQTDPATGWQFLGAGHRTYNPAQRYFVSEDQAGDGYAFGGNNPIMNSDPSGNRPKWLGAATQIMSSMGTLGMSAIHKKWANLVGISLMAALTVAGAVLSIYGGFAATPLLLGLSAVMTVSAGGLTFASAVVPTNRGLSIASAAVGAMAALVNIVMLGDTIICGVSSIMKEANLNGIGESVGMLENSINSEKDPVMLPADFSSGSEDNIPLVYGDKSDIEIILRHRLNFVVDIEKNFAGKEVIQLQKRSTINEVWKVLYGEFFSGGVKRKSMFSTLLLLGRENMTGDQLSLQELAGNLYALQGFHGLIEDTVIVGEELFGGNNFIKELYINEVLDNYSFAFWNAPHSESFGYMQENSDCKGLWHLYNFKNGDIRNKLINANELYGRRIFAQLARKSQFFVFIRRSRSISNVCAVC